MKKKFFIALILLCFLFSSALVSAKSYYLPKTEVYMKINPDALINVEEKISFNFLGDFSFAYRDIPKGQGS
ncbi:MAG: hypothetical protein AB1467_02580 [Candidatus Diapherotrites archaeon]